MTTDLAVRSCSTFHDDTTRSDGGARCGRRVPAPVRVPGGRPRDEDPVPDDPRHRGHVGSQRPHSRHLWSDSTLHNSVKMSPLTVLSCLNTDMKYYFRHVGPALAENLSINFEGLL